MVSRAERPHLWQAALLGTLRHLRCALANKARHPRNAKRALEASPFSMRPYSSQCSLSSAQA